MNVAQPIPPDKIDVIRIALRRRHPRYSLLFDVGMDTGLRITDILALRVKKVCQPSFTIIERKTRKKRVVSFSLEVYDAIQDFIAKFGLESEDYLFFRRAYEAQNSLSRSQIYKVMSRVGKSARIAQLSPHSMRKTYAINLYKETGSLEVVRQQLNHTNIATTMLYVFGSDVVRE